jgi:hypothetical protein
LLYNRSGLLGLSGVSNDMRSLEASDEPAAKQAIDYFVFRARLELGGLAAAMGGVDCLVFLRGHRRKLASYPCPRLRAHELDGDRTRPCRQRSQHAGHLDVVVPDNRDGLADKRRNW